MPFEQYQMNKYERLKKDLEQTGTGTMKAFGNSMLPLIHSGSTLRYKRESTYRVSDIVFCKVKGRYIDAHLITKIDENGRMMISNNKGKDNGWTRTVYGRVIEVIS